MACANEKPKLPSWALPDVDIEELNRCWEEAVAAHPEGVAGHVRDLLAEAKREFNEKWGIDPSSPTDYGG